MKTINPNEPEVYKLAEYKYLADQIENHIIAANYILAEIKEKFPLPEGLEWRIEGKRPRWTCIYGD